MKTDTKPSNIRPPPVSQSAHLCWQASQSSLPLVSQLRCAISLAGSVRGQWNRLECPSAGLLPLQLMVHLAQAWRVNKARWLHVFIFCMWVPEEYFIWSKMVGRVIAFRGANSVFKDIIRLNWQWRKVWHQINSVEKKKLVCLSSSSLKT